MYRLADALCSIQGGHHITVYAGAKGLAKRTGLDVRYVRRLLRRLVRDDVLQIVQWSARGGRFPEDEKRGGPGIAHGYELGRATLPKGGQVTLLKGGRPTLPPIVENRERRGAVRPSQANGGHLTLPSLSTRSLTLARTSGKKDGIGKEGTPKRSGRFRGRASLSPDALTAGRDQTPPGLRSLFRDVDSETRR